LRELRWKQAAWPVNGQPSGPEETFEMLGRLISGPPPTWNTAMRCVAKLVLALLLASTLSRLTAAEPREGWSKPKTDLRGRLVAEVREIKEQQVVNLFVELENTGSLRRSVVTHDPFAFELTVRDSKGNDVASSSQRGEVLSSPQVGVVPRESTLRFPVTLSQEKPWNLDITTHLWKLKPGRYTLAGKYKLPLPPPGEELEPGAAHPWGGELALPEITIDVK
jgi:hypothetical protein